MVAICLLGLVQPVALVAAEISADSSRIAMRHLEEVTIVCNPKVESDLFYMPSSVTLIGSESLQEMHTSSIGIHQRHRLAHQLACRRNERR